jgi:hypothetical protein
MIWRSNRTLVSERLCARPPNSWPPPAPAILPLRCRSIKSEVTEIPKVIDHGRAVPAEAIVSFVIADLEAEP